MIHEKMHWYEHSWENKNIRIDFDLLMFGMGAGFSFSSISGFLCVPFVCITYSKRGA